MSALTMREVEALIGTARPTPMPASAVLMPTTRAELSASAPPELPGLRAASVWMTSSMIRVCGPNRAGRDRPRALTTPAVTLRANPSGLPMATTSWPTRRRSASPSSAAASSPRSACRTARSDSGSRPVTWYAISRPSASVSWPRLVSATTWADVMRNPSAVSATAEPLPWGRSRPSRPRRSTCTAATDGATWAATSISVREYASSASCSRCSAGSGDVWSLCTNLLHVGQRFTKTFDPLRLVLAHEADAPGERFTAAAGHTRVDERVEDVPILQAQTGHHGHAECCEELLDVTDAGSPRDLAAEEALRVTRNANARVPRLRTKAADARRPCGGLGAFGRVLGHVG